MKDYIKKLLRENLQLADKYYFKDGKLSPRVKEIILRITNGDPYTKIMTDIYYSMLMDGHKNGQWVLKHLDQNYEETENPGNDVMHIDNLKKLRPLYNQLKEYNKNVFPIKGFNINGVENMHDFLTALRQRELILDMFKKLPSTASRNMKNDIRQERNGNEMNTYRDDLGSVLAYLSGLSNRDEETQKKILSKIFINNTTLDNVYDFVMDKENLIGGVDMTRKQIGQILKKDKEEYNELKVKYNKGDIMVIEVTGPSGIKEIGCNSLWCFTYNSRYGGLNWGDWHGNSTNGYCYVIINFSRPSDSSDFMYVLTKPLTELGDNDQDYSGNHMLFDMSNDEIEDPIQTIESMLDYTTAIRTMNFGVQPPKEKKKKYVDPNQLALDLHESIQKILRENLESHEIDSMLNQIKMDTDCDCCKYFDMNSLTVYGGLKHPVYYMINKSEINELEYLSPKQYIYAIARGFGISYEDAMGAAYQDEKAIKYADMMKSGSKSPIGFYVDDRPSQEGRHRAAAAMKLECKLIPIVKIIYVNNDYVHDFVETYKDYSREDLDRLFKEKGYKGVSDLDWREFQNYKHYRL